MRTIDKKILDPWYQDEVLAPYFNQNEFLDDSKKEEIFSNTQIPVQLIEGWYENQRRKKWEKENPEREKYVRIRNAEPELLKCFNENETYFSDESILNLMIKTELTFDDIKAWYKSIVKKINILCKKANPNFVAGSIRLGVKVDIFKNWLEIKRRVGSVIPKSARKEVLKLVAKMKTNESDPFRLNVSRTNMKKQQQLLKGLYHQDLKPSVEEKQLISDIVNCNYDKVEKWFSSKVENKTTDWYEIAKRELEAGFPMEKEDVDVFVEAKRRKFTKQEVEFLEHFFLHDRLPNEKMIIWMCAKLKCAYSKVKNWFTSARHKRKTVKNQENKSTLKSCETRLHFEGGGNENLSSQNMFERPITKCSVNHGTSTSPPKSQSKTNNYFSQLAINTHLAPNKTPNSYNPLYGRQLLDLAKKEDFNETSSNASSECVVDFELYTSSENDMEID